MPQRAKVEAGLALEERKLLDQADAARMIPAEAKHLRHVLGARGGQSRSAPLGVSISSSGSSSNMPREPLRMTPAPTAAATASAPTATAAASPGTKILIPPPRRSAAAPKTRRAGRRRARRSSPRARSRRGRGNRRSRPRSARRPRTEARSASTPRAWQASARHNLITGRVRRRPLEVVIEGDDAVHLGARQVQRLRHDRHDRVRHEAEGGLHVVQDRQERALAPRMAAQDLLDLSLRPACSDRHRCALPLPTRIR